MLEFLGDWPLLEFRGDLEFFLEFFLLFLSFSAFCSALARVLSPLCSFSVLLKSSILSLELLP